MLENVHVAVKVLPLEEVGHTRVVIGDYDTDRTAYQEKYSLLQQGVYAFVGVNINGAFYVDEEEVGYDPTTGEVSLFGLPTSKQDAVTFVFNKVLDQGELLNPVKMDIGGVETAKTVQGDYEVNPKTYSESYSLADFPVDEFIGLNVNGLFYCHPTNVIFESTIKVLTVKGLSLKNTDLVTLYYQAR